MTTFLALALICVISLIFISCLVMSMQLMFYVLDFEIPHYAIGSKVIEHEYSEFTRVYRCPNCMHIDSLNKLVYYCCPKCGWIGKRPSIEVIQESGRWTTNYGKKLNFLCFTFYCKKYYVWEPRNAIQKQEIFVKSHTKKNYTCNILNKPQS